MVGVIAETQVQATPALELNVTVGVVLLAPDPFLLIATNRFPAVTFPDVAQLVLVAAELPTHASWTTQTDPVQSAPKARVSVKLTYTSPLAPPDAPS
jgi:hypothetical protein